MEPAATLASAVDSFLPNELVPKTPEWGWYVPERWTYLWDGGERSPLARIERELRREADRGREQRTCSKHLVSGHKGTGKSTEILRIADQLSDRFEVVKIKASRFLNADDTNARDVLFVLAAQVTEKLRGYKELARLDGDPEAMAAMQMFAGRLPRVSADDLKLGFNLLGVLSVNLSLDQTLRSEVREIADRQPKDLLSLVNRPIAHLEAVVGRPVLVILDELDRARGPQGQQHPMFSIDFRLLTSFRSAAVLTIPVEAHFDERLADLHTLARENGCVIGHIKLWNDRFGQARFEKGWDVMRSFVYRRASPALFDPGAVDEAVRLSGGSFDQLRRVVRDAIDRAEYAGQPRVEVRHVEAAARDIRADLVRTFGALKHVAALHRIHEEHRIQQPEDLVYLPTLTVMEHLNDTPWFDTNPLLTPFVEETWAEAGRS